MQVSLVNQEVQGKSWEALHVVKQASHAASKWVIDRRLPIVSIVILCLGFVGQIVATSVMLSSFQIRTEMNISANSTRIAALEKSKDEIIQLIGDANSNREKLNEDYIRLSEQFAAMQSTMRDNVEATKQVRDELIAIKHTK